MNIRTRNLLEDQVHTRCCNFWRFQQDIFLPKSSEVVELRICVSVFQIWYLQLRRGNSETYTIIISNCKSTHEYRWNMTNLDVFFAKLGRELFAYSFQFCNISLNTRSCPYQTGNSLRKTWVNCSAFSRISRVSVKTTWWNHLENSRFCLLSLLYKPKPWQQKITVHFHQL